MAGAGEETGSGAGGGGGGACSTTGAGAAFGVGLKATGSSASSSLRASALAAAAFVGFLAPRVRRERVGRLVGDDSEELSGLLESSSDLGGRAMKAAGRPRGLVFQEAVSQGIHLFFQKLRGSVVQENMVCQLAFSSQWQLLDQALAGLFRGNSALL